MRGLGRRWLALASLLAVATCAAPPSGNAPQTPAQAAAPGAEQAPEARRALYGELHLHTENSFDAYVLMGTRTSVDDAYRFARGETIDYLGTPVRRREPLDFMAVTDHSEHLGVFNQLSDRNSAVSRSSAGAQLQAAIDAGALGANAARGEARNRAIGLIQQIMRGPLTDFDARGVSNAAWRREVEAANRFYQPGRFTTFIAYEWTSQPGGQNLHRNVIFRGDDAPDPFTSFDGDNPEALWAYLDRARAQGYEAMAIPHNANASNGLMYDWTRLDGRAMDRAYAEQRALNEPLAEIAQNKGTSETHPSLSPNDEFAGFEIFDRLLAAPQISRPPGSYLRDGLSRGLRIQRNVGVNPFQQGFVGGGDLHSGLSVSDETDYGGEAGRANLGGGRTTRAQAQQAFQAGGGVISSSAGLTGVWAEQNTRESIYAALRRRETFATSGTRIGLRFFGGWALPRGLAQQQDWVARAYASAAPMGSDLAQRPASARGPDFVIWAQKDPNGANLDRVQVVKVWINRYGDQYERVFDVAFQRGRRRDRDGRLAPIGDTVNAQTATYQNTIGSAQFLTMWRDPTFNPTQPAAYYVRVLEIPTPRWSTVVSVQTGAPLPPGTPVSIQERAWSSPIWYTPPAR